MSLGIVFAVRNEAPRLDGLLSSIQLQQGLEHVCCIAAVEGRSEDGSREILARWQRRLTVLRVLDNEARIAPVAFNLGIRACLAAGADVVLLVSGHSALQPGFLSAVQRILSDTAAAVVGCVLEYPPARSLFERASQAFVDSRLGRRQASYSRLTRIEETEIATFPAVRREVFEKVGLFDETMVRNQDIEFTERARKAGFRVVTSPELKCEYSPPSSLGRLVRQMYGNGVWVGQRPAAHGLRHLAPLAFYAAVFASGALTMATGRTGWWVLMILVCPYALAILIATLASWTRVRWAALWLPVLFLGAHAAYALGTFRGLFSVREPAAIPQHRKIVPTSSRNDDLPNPGVSS